MEVVSEICLYEKRLKLADREAREEIAILKDEIKELWKAYSSIMEK